MVGEARVGEGKVGESGVREGNHFTFPRAANAYMVSCRCLYGKLPLLIW